MTEPAWLTKWHAREALKNGRPDEAHRLLDTLVATGNRRAWPLRGDVVNGYVERANRSLSQNSVEEAWADLRKLEELAPGDRAVTKLRQSLIQHGVEAIRKRLDDGKPIEALAEIRRLHERPVQTADLIVLEMAAQEWASAEEMAERGEFAQARGAIEKSRRKLEKGPASLDRFERELERREDRFRGEFEKLRLSMENPASGELLKQADAVLSLAPKHRDAQLIRNRATQAALTETQAFRSSPTPTDSLSSVGMPAAADSTAPVKRFYLWIDGVGGYLVCLANQLTLGQSSLESGPVDVPLQADVSRFHASLKRDEEAYIFESSQPILLNGKNMDRQAVLKSGDTMRLNPTCDMRFQLPVPGCASARLEFPGTRRLPMGVDAVLLMADMLVLGAGEKVHVSMPDLEQPIKLFRQKDRIGIQWPGDFQVEGQKASGKALLPQQGSVTSASFALAIEPARK